MQLDEEGLRPSLSAEEVGLVLAYRSCCKEHQDCIRWFATASISRCQDKHRAVQPKILQLFRFK